MSLTRRNLLTASGSLAGYAAFHRLGLAQLRAGPSPVGPPAPAAARALYADIGPAGWTELDRRLRAVNDDIVAHGLRHIPGGAGTFLTGHPYNEFYDWDLYFENLYLSYYGVWPLCFTNLKEFLNREQPDGYVNRSLIKQRDRPRVRPHVGKIAAEVNGVVGCQDGIDWPGGKPEFGIRKRRRLAAQLGNSHAIARESEQPAGSREPINLAGMCVHKICIS